MLVLKRKFEPALSTEDSQPCVAGELTCPERGGELVSVPALADELFFKKPRCFSGANPRASSLSLEDMSSNERTDRGQCYLHAASPEEGRRNRPELEQPTRDAAVGGTSAESCSHSFDDSSGTERSDKFSAVQKEGGEGGNLMDEQATMKADDLGVPDAVYAQRKQIWTSYSVSAGAALFGRPYRANKGGGKLPQFRRDQQASSYYLRYIQSRGGFLLKSQPLCI